MSSEHRSTLHSQKKDSPEISRLTEEWSGVKISQYQVTRCVRVGRYNILLEAFSMRDHSKAAIKIPRQDQDGSRLIHERLVLEELDGVTMVPHYVLHGRCEDQKPLLAMEWIGGTSLEQRLRLSNALSKHDYFDYMLQIIYGIEELHHRGYALRNLTINNLMIHHGRVRLIDLGQATHMREPRALNSADPRQQDMAQIGQLMQAMLGSQGHEEAKFFCGAPVPGRLFTLIRQCTQLAPAERPKPMEIARVLKQLLEQVGFSGARASSQFLESNSSSAISTQGFEKDAKELNKRSMRDSIEMLRQTYEEPTRPKLKQQSLLSAEAREKLRRRFVKHLDSQES